MRRKTRKKKTKKLANAKPENYFILVTGVPLKNLKELANALENMNQWVFDHHVNEARNDFANWIRDVLKIEDLAHDILRIDNPKELEVKILRYLVNNYL